METQASAPGLNSLPTPNEPNPPHRRRIKIIGIAVTAIIAVAVVGILIALGVFQGSPPSQNGLRNGDYKIYSIVGYWNGTSINGTQRTDYFDVSSTGYDTTATYYNIPGWTPSNHHHSWNETGVSSIFEDTETIMTIWGLKSVDKHSYTGSSEVWYYFYGHETGGMYRQERQSGSNWITWELKETSISDYWEKNNA